jgi:hypothetical protein
MGIVKSFTVIEGREGGIGMDLNGGWKGFDEA